MIGVTARILAAADAYQAMTEPRPHRSAMSADQAAEALRQEVRGGRLDGDAANAVLAEAGHATPRARRQRPAGLSHREVEVLRLIARGMSNRDMASQLAPTREGLKLFIRALREGLPDLQCPIEEVVAEGDRVGGRFSLQGTHTGTLLGIPATGKGEWVVSACGDVGVVGAASSGARRYAHPRKLVCADHRSGSSIANSALADARAPLQSPIARSD
jgi:hypothetical protein